MKTHYEVLGISCTAGAEDIHRAYVMKSKGLDPERFDLRSSRDQRAQVNEMLREITAAYAVLKDTTLRAEYDKLLADAARDHAVPCHVAPSKIEVGLARPDSSTSSAAPASPATQERQLRAGHQEFSSLPKPIQDLVLARQSDRMQPQLRLPLDWSVWNYLGLLACAGILLGSLLVQAVPLNWLVLRPTIGRPWWDWKAHVALLYWGIVVGAIGYAARNIYRIIKSASHRLKSNLIVTPQYLVKTRGDDIWHWPIGELKEIRLDSRYHSPVSGLGYVTLVLASGEVGVGLLPPRKHKELVDYARAMKTEAEIAGAQDGSALPAGENGWLN